MVNRGMLRYFSETNYFLQMGQSIQEWTKTAFSGKKTFVEDSL